MKNKIYILVLIFLIACNSSKKNTVSVSVNIDSSKTNSIRIDKSEFDLNGTWGLTNYFDTIVERRELAKYRLQRPTWSAILLEIKNDSLSCFGSMTNDEYVIKKSNDTLITLTSKVSGDKWDLIISKPYLKLIQIPNSKKIDSTVYIFRKRNDLKYFTKEKKSSFIISDNVTNYFNEKLFKGKYINKQTQKEVIFGDNGELIGLEGFDSYNIKNYFGTLHMHKNLDVVTFTNKANDEYKQYNWVFSNNELLLTEFVYEKETYNGKTYEGDYFILGKEKIELINTKHKTHKQ